MNQPAILSGLRLWKSFNKVAVLRDVSFAVEPGTVHALCGENGAGKSTLVNLLTGIYRPDAGVVEFDGEAVSWSTTRDTMAAGVAVVHQEFSSIGTLTVAENVFLEASPTTRFGLIDRRRLEQECERLFDRLGVHVSPHALVEQLGVADCQLVELAKALRRNPRVLVLDEPTSVLSRPETEQMFRVLRELRALGVGIVFVSHRLDEIFDVADWVTVLKDGVVTSSGKCTDYDQARIVSAMVGRDLGELFAAKASARGELALEVRDLKVRSYGPAVSIRVDAGEIVGLAGLVGAGRTDVLGAIYGAIPAHGKVRVFGREYAERTPRRSLELGMAMISEARGVDGLFPENSIARNVLATSLGRGANGLNLTEDAERNRAEASAATLGFDFGHVGRPGSVLSGGNQQKTLFARAIETQPRLLLLDEPTRGIDIGAKSEIYELLRRIAEDGVAILLVSSELIEVVGLCDRVYVMRSGAIVTELSGDEITEDAIIGHAATTVAVSVRAGAAHA